MSPNRHPVAGEHGAVVAFFALFAPVAVLLLSFVIDIGAWFDHARHLQLQADAAALAAAEGFQPCNDAAIYSVAGQYGGAASVKTPAGETVAANLPLYNQQLGGTTQANIHALINSPTYYEQSSPVDSSVKATDPCTAGMVDVKLTETNLPWYLRLLRLGEPRANAHARVEIRRKSSDIGSFPVAINDLRPKAVEAYFVDESVSPAKQLSTCGTGSSLCSVALSPDGTSNGLSVWDNNPTPYAFPVKKPDIGVRVAVSGRSSLTGNMATDCGQTFVTCSDATSAALGLLHIQGYSGNGVATTAVPIARSVRLSGAPAGCSDGYFSNPATTCTLAVSAEVDYGTASPPAGADVDAVVGGACYALTYQSTSGTAELWASAKEAPAKSCSNFKGKGVAGTGYVPLAHEAGATQVDLQAFDGSMKEPKKFSAVQRSYAASSNSEPIQEAFLGRVGTNELARDEDSFRLCESGNEGEACTPHLTVKLALQGTLGDAQSVSDPIYTMRFSGTGSQNQSVNCKAANGGETFADTLASGCLGEWTINPTLTCPDTATDCIFPATGNKEDQVARGMNLRILGSEHPTTCTNPNHWKEFIFTEGVPNVSSSDPRVVTAFVTPYGSFESNGASKQYPIAEFATFYVTGWQAQGQGFSNPCQGNGDDTAQPGTIVGHFIKYVAFDTTGSGTETCELGTLDQCVTVLTR